MPNAPEKLYFYCSYRRDFLTILDFELMQRAIREAADESGCFIGDSPVEVWSRPGEFIFGVAAVGWGEDDHRRNREYMESEGWSRRV